MSDEMMKKQAAQILDTFRGGIAEVPTPLGKVFKKKADLSYEAAYDTSRTPLSYQDALYDAYLIMFPEYNLVEANKRYRHYYKFQPILSNCVDIHATFPFTDFELMVDNEEVKEYYTYLANDKYDLPTMNVISARDEALLGEAVFLGNWDKVNLEWEEWIQYPPEFVDITTIPGMSKRIFTVKPDPEIQKTIKDSDKDSEASKILVDILKQVNDKYYKAAVNDEPYNIPEERIMYFANKVDGYSKRGYPLTKRALQDLMHETDLRTLQHTFTQRHTFPIKLWKLGSESIGWVPSQKHYANFKKLLIQASADPDFNLVYHFGVQFEAVGVKDKIENLQPQFEYCSKRIMNAFYINDALLNGESPSYAGQVANTKLLMYRFATVRAERERNYRNKMFLPIARQQQLIKQSEGDKKTNTLVKSKTFRNNQYYLPEFMWRQQNVLNNYQLQQMMVQLYNDGAIPFGILSDIFGLSDKILNNYRKKEQGTYANRLTREIVDEVVKQDPTMSLKFALGEDPIELLKQKVKNDKVLEEANQNNNTDEGLGSSSNDDMGGLDSGGSSFDSRSPIDLGESESSSENESAGEAPMSETGEPPSNEPSEI